MPLPRRRSAPRAPRPAFFRSISHNQLHLQRSDLPRSACCYPPSAVRSSAPLLSAIRYPLSAFGSQLSAFSFQVSGFRFQIFALSFQVSAARMRIRRGDPCAASKPATNRTPSASGTHVVSAPGAGNPPKPADSHQATVVSCCASNTSPSLVSVPARSRTEIGNAPDNQACESDPGSSNEPFDRHN